MNSPTVAAVRLAIAFLQGVVLYLLYSQLRAKAWPATDGFVFTPLAVTATFVPLLAITSLGNLRPRTLTIWLAAAALLCVGLGIYDIWRMPFTTTWSQASPHIAPSPALWQGLTIIFFVVHTLVAAGDTQRKYIADYAQYHDAAWSLAIRHLNSVAFVAVFWALLWLGAWMFRLIKIEWFYETITKEWFFIPATTLAYASAIHLTDVRAGFVRGSRTLALMLLCWLLPLIVLITTGFLIALVFTGLQPLWNTRYATSLLLTAAATLIVLINTTYRESEPENATAKVLLYARLVGSAVLVPLIALAAYGLWLRIDQYGISTSRVIVIALIVAGACYAGGYLISAMRYRLQFQGIATTNIVAAFVIVGLTLALLTPIADPARIAVNNQLSRLESGQTTVDKFDFAFLRFHSGRYGEQALIALKAKTGNPEAERISLKANEALDWRNLAIANRGRVIGTFQPNYQANASTPQSRAANITVIHPAGATLPAAFPAQDWSNSAQKWTLPACLNVLTVKCEAILVDIDGDDTPEILLFPVTSGQSSAFKMDSSGAWKFIGTLQNAGCPGVRDTLRSGRFEVVTPAVKQIKVGELFLSVQSTCQPTLIR